MNKIHRVVLWLVFSIALAYLADVIYAYPNDHRAHLDQAVVSEILAKRIMMADVDGSDLPPQLDPAQVDATIAGVDANHNGIRDDVEVAILSEYPTSSASSTAVRAAEVQYAKELQLEFTSVFDSATLAAVMRQEGRGFICVPTQQETDYVESLEFNTSERKAYREDLYKKYMTSFALDSSNFCDLSF